MSQLETINEAPPSADGVIKGNINKRTGNFTRDYGKKSDNKTGTLHKIYNKFTKNKNNPEIVQSTEDRHTVKMGDGTVAQIPRISGSFNQAYTKARQGDNIVFDWENGASSWPLYSTLGKNEAVESGVLTSKNEKPVPTKDNKGGQSSEDKSPEDKKIAKVNERAIKGLVDRLYDIEGDWDFNLGNQWQNTNEDALSQYMVKKINDGTLGTNGDVNVAAVNRMVKTARSKNGTNVFEDFRETFTGSDGIARVQKAMDNKFGTLRAMKEMVKDAKESGKLQEMIELYAEVYDQVTTSNVNESLETINEQEFTEEDVNEWYETLSPALKWWVEKLQENPLETLGYTAVGGIAVIWGGLYIIRKLTMMILKMIFNLIWSAIKGIVKISAKLLWEVVKRGSKLVFEGLKSGFVKIFGSDFIKKPKMSFALVKPSKLLPKGSGTKSGLVPMKFTPDADGKLVSDQKVAKVIIDPDTAEIKVRSASTGRIIYQPNVKATFLEADDIAKVMKKNNTIEIPKDFIKKYVKGAAKKSKGVKLKGFVNMVDTAKDQLKRVGKISPDLKNRLKVTFNKMNLKNKSGFVRKMTSGKIGKVFVKSISRISPKLGRKVASKVFAKLATAGATGAAGGAVATSWSGPGAILGAVIGTVVGIAAEIILEFGIDYWQDESDDLSVFLAPITDAVAKAKFEGQGDDTAYNALNDAGLRIGYITTLYQDINKMISNAGLDPKTFGI